MSKSNKFGTFGGVFAPSILTILGVIMYLRLPAIVGEAGLWATIGIIVIAHIISVTTGLSVSSIATDKKVKAGGTYYMISRSLGLPIGGTLGLALFIGLSFSVSLYLIGFSESFLSYWGLETGINNIRITGTIVLLAVTTLTFISTSLALKTQYFILAAIVLSLVSIFMGTHEFKPTAPLFSNDTSTVPLMVLFGIFFPAVTGFEAGVSMSGDLKDSKKSIPRGSITAILVGFVVYIGLAFYFSYTVDGQALTGDSQILLKISRFPELVVAGIWGATLSSALGSILGAPRILQATAIDKITGRFFAKGYGASNEPRNALLFTFLIAEAGILIGELDVIARVVSIFFITTYGFLNLSCAFETWTSADFRPQFKVSGWISLIGAIACFIVMIELDFVATIVASLLLTLLFLYLKRKELTLDSGDAWSGIWASLVKKGLQRLTKDKLSGRNWRPNVLLFSGNELHRPELLEAGKLITGNMGILSAFELVESKEAILPKPKIVFDEKDKTAGYFKHRHLCHDIFEGMDEISRIYGFSGVQPNTILMGWSRDLKHRESFVKTISGFDRQDYNTLFLNYHKERAFGSHETIDVWWNGSGRNLAFAIYLLRHLTASLQWKATKIRVCYINEINSEREDLLKSFGAILNNFRLQAEIEIVNNELDQFNIADIITTKSSETDLVIMGLPDGQQQMRYDQINPMLDKLGSTLIINASKQFDDISVKNAENRMIEPTHGSEQPITLPPLKLSHHAVLATDIQKVDDRGMKILEIFHEKLFSQLFTQNIQATERLIEIIKGFEKNLAISKTYAESYRQKRQVIKSKNEFLFSVRKYLISLNEQNVETKFQVTHDAIEWYSDRLEADINLFPLKLSLLLAPEDIMANAADNKVVRGIKLRKRILSKVSRQVEAKLSYRKLANHHMHHERQVSLKSFLTSLLKDEGQFHKLLKSEIERAYDLWLHIDQETTDHTSPFEETIHALEQEIINQKEQSIQYARRLRLDFRKQVQTMNDHLSQLDADQEYKKIKRAPALLKVLFSENRDFAARSKHYIKNLVNKAYADMAILNTQSRVEEKIGDFKSELTDSVQKNLITGIRRYEEAINNEKTTGFLESDLQAQISLLPLFENHIKVFDQMIEDLPENLELNLINDQEEEEVMVVPVRKMVGHYLNNCLVSPTRELLETLQEQLRKSLVSCREMVSLARFNINNLEDIGGDNELKESEIRNDCKKNIDAETGNIRKMVEDFLQNLHNNVDCTFEPLSTLKLSGTSASFSRSLLDHQSRQVKTGVLNLAKQVREFSANQLSRLLYSRSKGLIFAKKLTHVPKVSVTSRLLDYKEQMTPDINIVKALPGYYVSLFSGRSSIDKEFWVKRATDEALFKKAIGRYKEGFFGGVLIAGERNTGKTTFSRFQALKHYKTSRCFQVYPKTEGSIQLADFKKALNEATGIKGSIDQVMNTIPEGTVIIINDLELWWQRAEGGLTIVNKLCQLIDTYGRKCLFVINTNPFTLKLINEIIPFNDYFIEVINCQSFESEELKDLILKRHRSTGFTLSLNGKKEGISEVGIARLFDSYFNISEGNPGVALNLWLSNITAVKDNHLIIRYPHMPGFSALKEMNADWQLVLVQLLLHKRLSFTRLQQNVLMEEQELRTTLLAMFRAALLTEKKSEVYAIDPFLEPLIAEVLKEKKLIS